MSREKESEKRMKCGFLKKIDIETLRGMYVLCIDREIDYLKEIKLLNAALDHIISRSCIPTNDQKRIEAFKERLIEEVRGENTKSI